MAGIELEEMQISLDLGVDFRTALGLGEFKPMVGFEFDVIAKSRRRTRMSRESKGLQT